MSFSPMLITLAGARRIFSKVGIDPIEIGDKVVGYTAVFRGKEIRAVGLADLCATLWDLGGGNAPL